MHKNFIVLYQQPIQTSSSAKFVESFFSFLCVFNKCFFNFQNHNIYKNHLVKALHKNFIFYTIRNQQLSRVIETSSEKFLESFLSFYVNVTTVFSKKVIKNITSDEIIFCNGIPQKTSSSFLQKSTGFEINLDFLIREICRKILLVSM